MDAAAAAELAVSVISKVITISQGIAAANAASAADAILMLQKMDADLGEENDALTLKIAENNKIIDAEIAAQGTGA